jgi:hypothetical protein
MVAKFIILARFADIDYSSSQEEEAFMASPYDLRILYSNIKEKIGRLGKGSLLIKVFSQIRSSLALVELIIPTMAEARISKMSTSNSGTNIVPCTSLLPLLM